MKRFAILLLLNSVVLSHSARCEPHHELFAEFYGEPIKNIEFVSPITLNERDLYRSLNVEIGEAFNEDSHERLLAALRARGIFEHIDITSTHVDGGIALRIDLALTAHVDSVSVSGNSTLSEDEIRRAAGIRSGNLFSLEDLSTAKQRIEQLYYDAGHFTAEIFVELKERLVSRAIVVQFAIDEGQRSEIAAIEYRGEDLERVSEILDDFREDSLDLATTKSRKKRLTQDLKNRLRQAGYLEASVRLETIAFDAETSDSTLLFLVEHRDPLNVVFVGNQQMSSSKLLELLRAESRTIPFGPGAIPRLVRDVERFYQARGYYYVNVMHQLVAPMPEAGAREYVVVINEGPQVHLEDIEFEGSDSVADSELLAVIKSRTAFSWPFQRWEPGYVLNDRVQGDVERIAEFYRTHGFLDVEVSHELVANDDRDELVLIFSIKENAQSYINSVSLVWRDFLKQIGSSNNAVHLLDIKPRLRAGALFDKEQFEIEREALQARIAERGYPNAIVEIEIDGLDLRYLASPGKQIRVGKIYNVGNIFTKDNVINRELSLRAGELWNPRKVLESERRLYQLGIFRSVAIEAMREPLDSEVEDLAVRISERETGTFEVGGKFTTEDGFNLVAGVSQRNLGGDGNTLGFGMDGYFKTGSRLFDAGRANVTYSVPHLFGTESKLSSELFVKKSVRLVNEFSYDRFGGHVFLDRAFGEALKGRIGIVTFRERTFDVPKDIEIGPDDRATTFYNGVSLSLEYDGRDDVFNPRRGYRTITRAEVFHEGLGSEVSFYHLYGKFSYYLPLAPRLVWANNFVGNFFDPLADTDVIPLGQRIFLGGRTSLRGFSVSAIGPRGVDGNIVGGDQSVNLNSEFLFSFTDNIIAVAFLDLGQTILENPGNFRGVDTKYSKLRYSPGAGLRYRTPIGPIGLEYGFALDREFGERFGRFHLTIGGAF